MAVEVSAHKVRNKRSASVRKREDQVEEEELESGEINLVPYLDIVTNLMLVFLSAVSSGIIFSQINTTLPDSGKSASASDKPPDKPEEITVKLVLTVTRDKAMLWSVSGLEGTLQAPKAQFPRTGRTGDVCDGGYMCESGNCDSKTGTCKDDATARSAPVFDYRAINAALIEIANRRFGGKQRPANSYDLTLMADQTTPYSTIISMMNAVRCKLPEIGKDDEGCLLPTEDENLKKAADPIDKKAHLFDTTRVNYDANTMGLFPDIRFSGGFE